jgi:hypothetical protein
MADRVHSYLLRTGRVSVCDSRARTPQLVWASRRVESLILLPAPTPAYHYVGWHVVVRYGGPEWFRMSSVIILLITVRQREAGHEKWEIEVQAVQR